MPLNLSHIRYNPLSGPPTPIVTTPSLTAPISNFTTSPDYEMYIL